MADAPRVQPREAAEAPALDETIEQPMPRLRAGATSDPRGMLPAEGLDLRSHLLAIERGLIEQAMERAGGTVAQAARLLGLRRTTLAEKLRRFGMSGGDTDSTMATED